ncbi:BgTH12-04063 [Blumeria graminis f. sp. triticale]|uniref:Bgt-979 n=3 Tax=Blumeria graminis TaxID=34373 RepID=A0A061HFB3_BLUGR|nr:hypothetical protein BGT96224_979 [Blumeria graminis f. sp. tritici 96224]CAD6499958.1 BgTH12-04063 [Blumeria graminis f. sp. triticale]VCU40133.1 Bgt-979 [Blumeria graminis f. sp. tritici]
MVSARWLGSWIFIMFATVLSGSVMAEDHNKIPLPSYHYGAKVPVSCLNRSTETGEHISNEKDELEYVSFPICNETGQPLELRYGIEEELNCTIPMVADSLFHLIEFYIHNDAPLSCRIPSRPAVHATQPEYRPDYVPLIFALAGTLQLSHLHISTHLNVLIHSTPKHHLHHHDSGVIDSGAAYSTSPLSHTTGPAALTRKLVIGDPLPLMLSVRWFPTPHLPRENGKIEWAGMGGHFYASTFFYCLTSAVAGAVVSSMWFFGIVLPKRLKRKGGLGGATPLAYGVGKGWGVGKKD